MYIHVTGDILPLHIVEMKELGEWVKNSIQLSCWQLHGGKW